MPDFSAVPSIAFPIARLGEGSYHGWMPWPEDASPFNGLDLYKCLPIDHELFIVAWLYLSSIALLLIYAIWHTKDRQRIQFFLSDYWAAAICLLPAFALLPDNASLDDLTFNPQQAALIGITVHAIIAGMWTALVLSCPRKSEPLPRHGAHFVAVLSGGFLGLVAVFYFAFCFNAATLCAPIIGGLIEFAGGLVLLFLYLCYVYPPLLLPTAFGLFVLKKMRDVF